MLVGVDSLAWYNGLGSDKTPILYGVFTATVWETVHRLRYEVTYLLLLTLILLLPTLLLLFITLILYRLSLILFFLSHLFLSLTLLL